ncbi:hypothetical protein [Paenibacillus radicis (ex Gao et al. 2016)]|uniref:Uncharacterized protein n=1 Tax=Paenibacillus radicis (ex Gao et al. 2016) TaxID=1737354 RepID=A0A917M0N8_9BACL|nr:hypothetical protein [Paenibacillus radicis (ex Gao et al. 2016)]GGG70272.1 hypothetical protein GCM10010918_26980 [Paenibacillus radicis (ex Gao et al. 2016)]
MSKIREDLTLAKSSFSHIIDVPVEKVDIGQWLFSLSEAEYQRCCPPDHIAVGTTTTEDGRPMSINVEKIGTSLSIQHYVGEVVGKHNCRLVSITDIFISNEQRTQMQVIWELSVKPVNADQSEFTNFVETHPSEHLLGIFESQGLTFEQASASRQEISEDHNRREAPLFAKSIERAAGGGVH